jgi:hypothetical protein
MTPFLEQDWKEMMDAFQEKQPPFPCPECGRQGFYGVRSDGNTPPRLYHMCKFCGFFQNVGGDPQQLIPTVHSCGRPAVLGTPYVQWAQPSETTRQCEGCGDTYSVASHTAQRPHDDTHHPWHQVPTSGTFEDYAAFWALNGLGKVYL